MGEHFVVGLAHGKIMDVQIIPQCLTHSSDGQTGGPIGVEGQELFSIEAGVGFADPLDAELGCQFLTCELLAVAARRPAEQGDEIHESLGQVAGDAEIMHVDFRGCHTLLDGLFLVPLAHLRPVHVEDEGKMRIARRRKAQRALQSDMFRRVVQVLLAS